MHTRRHTSLPVQSSSHIHHLSEQSVCEMMMDGSMFSQIRACVYVHVSCVSRDILCFCLRCSLFDPQVNCHTQSAWKSHVSQMCLQLHVTDQLHKRRRVFMWNDTRLTWDYNREASLICSSVNSLDVRCLLKFSFDVKHACMHRR